jgi:transcriptional regulator with XRE-family HTH domain
MIEKSNIYWYEMSDSAILETLGLYIKETRLKLNKTQEEIAQSSGIERMTLARIEKGSGGTMATFIRLLRSLEQLQVLKTFEIPTQISPIQLAKLEQQKRTRAFHKRSPDNKKTQSDW